MARATGERIPGRMARVQAVRHEQRSGRRFVVYTLSDSLYKPQGKPPRERADWRRAA